LPLSQPIAAQRFERLEQHLLNEIVCGSRRSQVAKAIQSNPRCHAAAQFGFRLAIAVSNAWREVRVGQPAIHGAILSPPLRSYSGSGPRMSMLYFAASLMSFVMSGGPGDGSLISTTN